MIVVVAWFALWGILVALDASGSGPFEAWPAGISFITFGVLAQVALGYFVGRGWALLCPCVGVAALIGIGLLEPADEPLSGAVVLIFLILPIAVAGVAVGYGLRQWLDPSRRPT